MHFLIFLLNSFSWCFSRLSSMSVLISSSPSMVFSFLFSCELDITSVLSAFSLDAAAAAFVSSPPLRVAVASGASLLTACSVSAAAAFVSSFEGRAAASSTTSLSSACSNSLAAAFASSFKWCAASAFTTSLPDRVLAAAAAFASSFQLGNAATSASITPSACFDIFKDYVIFGFCVVAAISASCLIFLSSSA